jgi:hypothetical protein
LSRKWDGAEKRPVFSTNPGGIGIAYTRGTAGAVGDVRGADPVGRRVRVDGLVVEIGGGGARRQVRDAAGGAATGAVKLELAGIASDVPVNVRPLEEVLGLSLAPNRAGAAVLG